MLLIAFLHACEIPLEAVFNASKGFSFICVAVSSNNSGRTYEVYLYCKNFTDLLQN